MPRKALGPRLWLDRSRDSWVIRDGAAFIRTGFLGDQMQEAEEALATYKSNNKFTPDLPEKRYGYGLIYFITCDQPDHPVKIGFTEKLSSGRIKQLQIASPYVLRFLGTISGSIWQERWIHERFEHLRLEGEWFRRAPDLLAFIADVCAAGDVWGMYGKRAAEVDGRPAVTGIVAGR